MTDVTSAPVAPERGIVEESWYRRQSPAIIPHRGQGRGELYLSAQASELLVRIGGREKLETAPDGSRHAFARLLLRAPEQVLVDFDRDLSGLAHAGHDTRMGTGRPRTSRERLSWPIRTVVTIPGAPFRG